MGKLVKMRDTYRDLADIVDELILLETKEETEETKKELENVIGRYFIKATEMNSISNQIEKE